MIWPEGVAIDRCRFSPSRWELAEAKLTRAETAFGILSDQYPEEAQEAWRKAGELCEGAK